MIFNRSAVGKRHRFRAFFPRLAANLYSAALAKSALTWDGRDKGETMSDANNGKLSQHDLDILRRLGRRKAQLAADPVNIERREAWYAHDAGEPSARPMVLAEIAGVRDPHPPVSDSDCHCQNQWARRIERGLVQEIYQFDELKDDHVIEPRMQTNWKVKVSDYGVQQVVHNSDADVTLAARSWDPPIKDIDADFDKLHRRTYAVDREATMAQLERLEEVFDGILPVTIRGKFFWSMGLTWPAIDLVGLQNLMLLMYDNPNGLHRLMTFLRDDHLAYAKWLESEGLLNLDNENDYIGSGSMGYTHDLPEANHKEGEPLRLSDLWVLSESQETVGVGPELFEEFIFPYQLDIARNFGKSYYGCCEPVNNRWHVLKRLPNLARVSVSPWADEEFMAQACGTQYVYSRKPKPTQVSTGRFDEDAIRADLRHTLDVTRRCGCRTEIIMKDVHTLHDEPDRLARWVQLTRQEIASQ